MHQSEKKPDKPKRRESLATTNTAALRNSIEGSRKLTSTEKRPVLGERRRRHTVGEMPRQFELKLQNSSLTNMCKSKVKSILTFSCALRPWLTGTPTLGDRGAVVPPAFVQGLNYFSAKMFMMCPQ